MATGSVTNPYGNNAQMVDRLIGTAYATVKLVADNLSYVKHVSQNLPHIVAVEDALTAINAVEAKLAEITIVANDISNVITVAGSIDAVDNLDEHMVQILALYNSISDILTLAASLPAIQVVSANIAAVHAVYTDLDNIDAMVAALPDMMLVLAQKDEILQAVIDAEAARDAAEQYAQDALENSTSVAFATTEEAIAGTSASRVMSPKTTKDVIDNLGVGELLVAPKSFSGVAGDNKVYVLDHIIGGVGNVLVFVGGVRQRPTLDYTASGSNLTILTNPEGLAVDTLIMATTNEINTLGGKTADEFLWLYAETALMTFTFEGTTRSLYNKLTEGEISVQDFGVSGEYSTTHDDSVGFQNAINFAIASRCSLRIPDGDYLIKSQVLANLAVNGTDIISIKGDSTTGTRIRSAGFTGSALKISGGAPQKLNMYVGNFQLLGDGTGNIDAVEINNCAFLRVEGLDVQGCKAPLVTQDTDQCLVYNNTFRFNRTGPQHKEALTASGPNSLTYLNTAIGNCSKSGIYVGAGGNFNYYGGSIQFIGAIGDADGYSVKLNDCTLAVFSGVDIEHGSGYSTVIMNNTANELTAVFTNCTFLRNPAFYGTYQIVALGNKIQKIKLSGNYFMGHEGYTPSAGRPVLAKDNTLAQFYDDDSNFYKDVLEAPPWYSQAGEWRTYTPTLTWQTTTPTSVVTTGCKFKRLGPKTYAIHLIITMTGTGAGQMSATLPQAFSVNGAQTGVAVNLATGASLPAWCDANKLVINATGGITGGILSADFLVEIA